MGIIMHYGRGADGVCEKAENVCMSALYAGRRSAGLGSPGHRPGEETPTPWGNNNFTPSPNPIRDSMAVAVAVIPLSVAAQVVFATKRRVWPPRKGAP